MLLLNIWECGFLRFHVAPGDLVERGDPIATSTSLLGRELNTLKSPRSGIVMGMTTMPSVAPGDPVCHLAFGQRRALRRAVLAHAELTEDSLHERTREDLSSSVLIDDAEN